MKAVCFFSRISTHSTQKKEYWAKCRDKANKNSNFSSWVESWGKKHENDEAKRRAENNVS